MDVLYALLVGLTVVVVAVTLLVLVLAWRVLLEVRAERKEREPSEPPNRFLRR